METLKRITLAVFMWFFTSALLITTTVRAEQASQMTSPPLKEYRIVRSISEEA